MDMIFERILIFFFANFHSEILSMILSVFDTPIHTEVNICMKKNMRSVQGSMAALKM